MNRISAAPVWVLACLVAVMAGNVAGWLAVGPLPDEAYYWVWSQRLELGYYDHPPMVAWLVRPAVELFGNNAFAIRLPAMLATLVGAVVAFHLGGRMAGPRAGWLAALVWLALPIVQAGSHLMTPDVPALLFGWLALLLVFHALEHGRLELWVAAGVATGLALLGKYTAVLIPIAVLVALLASPDTRRQLRTAGPWLGALAALLVFLPVVYWNWQHQWVSFSFQWNHGVDIEAGLEGGAGWRFLGFLIGQALVATPFALVAMAALAARHSTFRSGEGRLLASWFWVPMLFFGAAAFTADSPPNWAVLAYPAGSVLLGIWLDRLRLVRWQVSAIVGVVLLAVAATNLVRFPMLLGPLLERSGERTQLSQSYGWSEVVRLVQRQDEAQCAIMADRHQNAAMLALYLGNVERVVLRPDARMSQYQLWQVEGPGSPCIYLEQQEHHRPAGPRIIKGRSWYPVDTLRFTTPDRVNRQFVLFRASPPVGSAAQ